MTRHILIVDPDRIYTQALCRYFEHKGYTVSIAHTAQLGVQRADEKQPDAVIIEADLPRHNALEFIYEFRSYSEWRDVPVLLLTSRIAAYEAQQRQMREHLGSISIHDKIYTSLPSLEQNLEQMWHQEA